MGNMFANCKKLEFLDVSSFDTRNVEEMYSTFMDCHSLTSIDISNFDVRNVIELDYMLYNCPKLEFLNLTNFELDMDIVENCENIFDNDVNLHLIIKSELYYNIIEYNDWLNIIYENITIID